MRQFIAQIGILFILTAPFSAEASEIDELRIQIQELREKILFQQEEMEQRRREEEKQQAQLIGKIEALQEDLHTMTARQESVPLPDDEKLASASPVRNLPALFNELLNTSRINIGERDADLAVGRERYARQTPSGLYADPASFFFLHGYSTIVYADFEKGLGAAPGAAPQILIPGTSSRSGKHESGFRNDTALFIGSELTDNLSGLFEIHMVGNARDPVITESKVVWEPWEMSEGFPSLRLIGGRYWWPFGIHNEEWFSAVNGFNLISPAASEVVPAHWNELGLMAEGEWEWADHFGMNYLVSIGNGVSSFELSDNVGSSLSNQFDHDSSRTVTTRLGLVPGIEGLEIGFSFSTGGLRKGLDTSFATTDARRFEADLTAYGVDATYVFKDIRLRGFWYVSEEDLTGASVDRFGRNGGTLEAFYKVFDDVPLLHEVILKGRASTAKDVTLSDGSFRRSQYGVGVNLKPHEHFILKTEYFVQDEEGVSEVDNDGFAGSATIEF